MIGVDQMGDKRKTALAGGFISQPLAALFSLRSLYEEVSKSKIVGDLVTEYLLSGPSVEEMCDKVADRILKAWLYLEKYRKCPWEEYLESEKTDLEKNNISEEHIHIILEKVEQKKKEQLAEYGANK